MILIKSDAKSLIVYMTIKKRLSITWFKILIALILLVHIFCY